MNNQELKADQVIAGKEALQLLDESDIRITAAFWFLITGSGWKYVLVSPAFDTMPATQRFEKIHAALGTFYSLNQDIILSMSLIDTKDPTVQLLKMAINTGPEKTISNMRFTSNVINGAQIDDALIYRMS